MAASPAFALNDDGSVVGHTQPGAVITVTSPSTGLTRTVVADSKGSYRFPFLPVGDYHLEASKDGKALGETHVTVTLGNPPRSTSAKRRASARSRSPRTS